MQQLLVAAAQQVAEVLAVKYPVIAQTNPKRIEEAAIAAANEIPQFKDLYEKIHNHAKPLSELVWSVTLLKKQQVITKGNEPGAGKPVATFAAPVSMQEACKHGPAMVMTCSHVSTLTQDPLSRAELYLFGYLFRFALGVRAPKAIGTIKKRRN